MSYQTNIHDGVTGQIHAAHGHGCYIYTLTLTITASKCMNKRLFPIILDPIPIYYSPRNHLTDGPIVLDDSDTLLILTVQGKTSKN